MQINRATISVFRFANSVLKWLRDNDEAREMFRRWKMEQDNDEQVVQKAEEIAVLEYSQHFFEMLRTTEEVVNAIHIIYYDQWHGYISIALPVEGGE